MTLEGRKGLPRCCVCRINIIKMAVLLKVVCRFSVQLNFSTILHKIRKKQFPNSQENTNNMNSQKTE